MTILSLFSMISSIQITGGGLCPHKLHDFSSNLREAILQNMSLFMEFESSRCETKVNAFARAATPLSFIITEFMNIVRVTDGGRNLPTAA